MLLSKDRRASDISNLRRSSLISLTFGNDLGPFVPEGDFSFPHSSLLAGGLGRNSVHQNLEAGKVEANASGSGGAGNTSAPQRAGSNESMLDLLDDDAAGQQQRGASATNPYTPGYHDQLQQAHAAAAAAGQMNITGHSFPGLAGAGWNNGITPNLINNANLFPGGARGSTFSLSGGVFGLGGGFDESGSSMLDDHHMVYNSSANPMISNANNNRNNNLPGLINMANHLNTPGQQYGNQAIQRLLGVPPGQAAEVKKKATTARKRKTAASAGTKKQQKLRDGSQPCVTPNAQKLALNDKLQGVKLEKVATKKGGKRAGAASKKQKVQKASPAPGPLGLNQFNNPMMPGNLSVNKLIGQALMNNKTSKGGEKKKKQLGAPKRSRELSSKFRGVSKCSKDGRWQARIRVGKQVKYLGRFKNEEEAARCYDEAAAKLHGKRAQFNFPVAAAAAAAAAAATGSGSTQPPPPPME